MDRQHSHSFFFSSRRRHTRSLRDWSSDVCSSDLFRDRRSAQQLTGTEGLLSDDGACRKVGRTTRRPREREDVELAEESNEAGVGGVRSEERRVGKEGRGRGWPDHAKKKKNNTEDD